MQVCLFHALWTLTLLTIIIGRHIGCSVRLEKPIRETQTPLTGLLLAVKGLILLSEGCICLLWSVFHNNCESFWIESACHTLQLYKNNFIKISTRSIYWLIPSYGLQPKSNNNWIAVHIEISSSVSAPLLSTIYHTLHNCLPGTH